MVKGLDSWITGHWGEDQLASYCAICGTRYDAGERAGELGYPEDAILPDTCSDTCDREAEARLTDHLMRESVPARQSEQDMIQNGGFIQGKRKKR